LLKGYWYQDGYIRTSSEEYDLKDISNPMIHLTNDAVQKNNGNYGKFEDYNKMSFSSFKKYLFKLKIPETKFDEAYEQMKLIAYYLIASVSSKIKRKQYTFEVFTN
jgi:tubulin polyglutamylase TTLL1